MLVFLHGFSLLSILGCRPETGAECVVKCMTKLLNVLEDPIERAACAFPARFLLGTISVSVSALAAHAQHEWKMILANPAWETVDGGRLNFPFERSKSTFR
ncbi:hypothetical protein CPC08DRAFT_720994 [Agrocybe pediades]|nr:hypothetical protein CPC08DRAFT_720994 [Agrocybe pediades]